MSFSGARGVRPSSDRMKRPLLEPREAEGAAAAKLQEWRCLAIQGSEEHLETPSYSGVQIRIASLVDYPALGGLHCQSLSSMRIYSKLHPIS